MQKSWKQQKHGKFEELKDVVRVRSGCGLRKDLEVGGASFDRGGSLSSDATEYSFA